MCPFDYMSAGESGNASAPNWLTKPDEWLLSFQLTSLVRQQPFYNVDLYKVLDLCILGLCVIKLSKMFFVFGIMPKIIWLM